MREAMPHAHLPVCEHRRGAARNPCDPACRSAWMAAQLACISARPGEPVTVQLSHRRAIIAPVVTEPLLRSPCQCIEADSSFEPPPEWLWPLIGDSLISREERLSRPAEFHHRPLAEPSVRLSPHSAPIRQTCRPYGLSVARIEVLLFPVASVMRPPDPTPSLQLRYEPSSLSGRRRRACALATVRRSNCTYSFPVCSFHEDSATSMCKRRNQPNQVNKPVLAVKLGLG
jgi:hypothetical protein